ncbi:MAG: hypothetical protein QS721_00755 [Candidatus Endonucleobacter sp. (ex Gigantidas childressi)]|nr:hypothetical protein [Candidatus Endonucleobacter sp. (ex Gigantidas childressi)]
MKTTNSNCRGGRSRSRAREIHKKESSVGKHANRGVKKAGDKSLSVHRGSLSNKTRSNDLVTKKCVITKYVAALLAQADKEKSSGKGSDTATSPELYEIVNEMVRDCKRDKKERHMLATQAKKDLDEWHAGKRSSLYTLGKNTLSCIASSATGFGIANGTYPIIENMLLGTAFSFTTCGILSCVPAIAAGLTAGRMVWKLSDHLTDQFAHSRKAAELNAALSENTDSVEETYRQELTQLKNVSEEVYEKVVNMMESSKSEDDIVLEDVDMAKS